MNNVITSLQIIKAAQEYRVRKISSRRSQRRRAPTTPPPSHSLNLIPTHHFNT